MTAPPDWATAHACPRMRRAWRRWAASMSSTAPRRAAGTTLPTSPSRPREWLVDDPARPVRPGRRAGRAWHHADRAGPRGLARDAGAEHSMPRCHRCREFVLPGGGSSGSGLPRCAHDLPPRRATLLGAVAQATAAAASALAALPQSSVGSAVRAGPRVARAEGGSEPLWRRHAPGAIQPDRSWSGPKPQRARPARLRKACADGYPRSNTMPTPTYQSGCACKTCCAPQQALQARPFKCRPGIGLASRRDVAVTDQALAAELG